MCGGRGGRWWWGRGCVMKEEEAESRECLRIGEEQGSHQPALNVTMMDKRTSQ